MIKKIILTESDFHKIIENSVKLMLSESLLLEDSRINPVKRIIRQALGNTYNLDAVVDSEDKYVNHDPNTTWLKYFIFKLRHALGMMTNSDYPYLALAARLAFSDEVRLDKKNEASEEVETLKKIMNLIKNDNALFQEVNNNPNITFGKLVNRFQQQFEAEKNADSEAANNVEVTDNGYEIKEVPDYKTAKYYGQFSCSQSRLCYTHNEETWNDYTDGGLNTAYICLRRGWEDVPEVATEGNPYDTYGLSMIFAFISPKGELVRSNCRWNHHNQGPYIDPDVDKAFTKESLAKVVGAPFDSVFKPHEISNEAMFVKAIENGGNDFLVDNVEGDFVIPEGTKIIGIAAFANCENLKSVIIPSSVKAICYSAFYYCTDLTSVTISEGVEMINSYAFSLCKKLTSITIPSSVNSIANNAFEGCTFTKESFINNSSLNAEENKYWGAEVYDYVLDGMYVRNSKLFRYKGNDSNLKIPNGVKLISYNVFCDNKNVTSITMPNSVTEIGICAFCNCENLSSINISDNVTIIDREAFSNCKKLRSITIPSSVTKIGWGAFEGCVFSRENFINNSSLNAEKHDYWGAYVFDYVIDKLCINNGVIVVYGGKNSRVEIPNIVTEIGSHSFSYNKGLTEVIIGSWVKSIGYYAFYECANLKNVIIHDGLTEIKMNAFSNCGSLTSITIPDSVTSIGKDAFYNCSNNLVVYIKSEQTEQLLRLSDFEGKIEYIK